MSLYLAPLPRPPAPTVPSSQQPGSLLELRVPAPPTRAADSLPLEAGPTRATRESEAVPCADVPAQHSATAWSERRVKRTGMKLSHTVSMARQFSLDFQPPSCQADGKLTLGHSGLPTPTPGTAEVQGSRGVEPKPQDGHPGGRSSAGSLSPCHVGPLVPSPSPQA